MIFRISPDFFGRATNVSQIDFNRNSSSHSLYFFALTTQTQRLLSLPLAYPQVQNTFGRENLT